MPAKAPNQEREHKDANQDYSESRCIHVRGYVVTDRAEVLNEHKCANQNQYRDG
jgi:hypothetical protein